MNSCLNKFCTEHVPNFLYVLFWLFCMFYNLFYDEIPKLNDCIVKKILFELFVWLAMLFTLASLPTKRQTMLDFFYIFFVFACSFQQQSCIYHNQMQNCIYIFSVHSYSVNFWAKPHWNNNWNPWSTLGLRISWRCLEIQYAFVLGCILMEWICRSAYIYIIQHGIKQEKKTYM